MYEHYSVLRALGYQRGGSNYKMQERWVDDFAVIDGQLHVSERYATIMSLRRIVRHTVKDMKEEIQLKLQFPNAQIEGGSHD